MDGSIYICSVYISLHKEGLENGFSSFWGNRFRDRISRSFIEEFLMLDAGLASFRKVSRSPRNQTEPTKIRNPAGWGLSCSAPSFTLIQKATVGRHNWFHRRVPVLSGYMFLRITARSPRDFMLQRNLPDISLNRTALVSFFSYRNRALSFIKLLSKYIRLHEILRCY